MTSENSFARIPKNGLPLPVFLGTHHQVFSGDPEPCLKPLVDYLSALHDAGEAHGSILPGCLVVGDSGVIDIDLFNSRRGHPEKSELTIYYPHGTGSDLADSVRKDVQALGGVLHFIITDQAPARRDRRPLAENPASADWPPAFIEVVDRMLEGSATLAELSTSLLSSAPPPVAEIPLPLPEVPLPPVQVPPPRPKPPAIRLPNAMVGRDYSAEIPVPAGTSVAPNGKADTLSEFPAGLEIREMHLYGIPEIAGDFEIEIGVHSSSTEGGSVNLLLALTINPDPRSLWKNEDSDRDDPFWKPDSDGKFLSGGPLEVLAASLRGRSHAHVGGFRDDDLAMAWYPVSGWYSLTVADGAGSSLYSRRGSQIACEKVESHISGVLAESSENSLGTWVSDWAAAPNDPTAKAKLRTALYNLFGHAAFEARNAIDAEAARLKTVARDFHTTLITSVVHPLVDGRWFIATFSIGDGAAAVMGAPNGNPCLLTRPDGGEFAGQTVFLTMKEALATTEAVMSRINFHLVDDFKGLLMVTDGISDPRFESDLCLADPAAWDSLWDEIEGVVATAASGEDAAAALVEWMSFHSPGHHDDRTVILAKPIRK